MRRIAAPADVSDEPRATSSVAVWVAASLVVGAALALRLRGLGAQELWLDEAFSFNAISGPGWLAVVRASEPPLYPCLLHGWSAVAGTGEAALRLPSVLFGTAFVVAVMWAGRELFDRAVALWSGLVAATSPIHVYYSQEARAYALLTLLLVCTYVLVARAVRTNGWGRWAFVALCMAAGPYTHYLAPLGLAPTIAIVLLAREPGRLPRYAAAVAVAALAYAPWVVWGFVTTPHSFAGLDWIRHAWELTPPRWAIPKSLEVLYLGPHTDFIPIQLKQFASLDLPPPMRALGLAALSALGAWVAWPWGARPDDRRARWATRALWALLLGPLGLLAGISLVRPVYLVGRYDQLALPAFLLLAGVGLAELESIPRWGRALAVGFAVVLLLPVGIVLVRYHGALPSAVNRRAAAALSARVRDGDVVVFSRLRGYPLLYQLDQLGYRVGPGSCEQPASRRRFACWQHPPALGAMITQEELEQGTSPAGVARALDAVYLPALAGPGHDVFVVVEALGVVESGLVSQLDRPLLDGLRERGFEFVAIDPALGILQLRRAG